MAYIDKNIACDLLAKKVLEEQQVDECAELTTQECLSIVRAIPTADVEKVKHGEWIINDFTGRYECSICKSRKPYETRGEYLDYWDGNYCRICGAKMDGGKEE